MSLILRLGDVNSDASISRIVPEDSEYDRPVDSSPGVDDVYNSPPQTYPGCFGLPYQDHNYGAPPPPTPPQTPPIVTPAVKETVEIKEEIVVTSDVPTQQQQQQPPLPLSPPAVTTQEDQDDPTRCICDFVHDDGYMIQCDKCSVWQHIVCMGLDRDSIPDVYFCELCHPRRVDKDRAREFQIRKREFLKTLVIKSHDSSTDTDPEEVNNRLKAYGLDPPGSKQKQKIKLKKRKERNNSKNGKRLKIKDLKTEKENTSADIHRRNKLLVKDFSSRNAQVKREKLSKKIEKMRAERLSKEMKEDKFSSDDLREDEKIINTMNNISTPLIQDENAQNPWDMNTFNEWEQSYEIARYNQYTTYVQEYLNSTCVNGHHNDIADLVTDGLRVQRCRVKALKNKKKGLESSCTIPNGQPVIEVIGKVMTRQQYDKDNFGQRQLSPFVFFYGTVFDLDLVIDASDYGNDARFIRRSCQPNAAVHHVVAGGQAHFIAVASKEIPENTEITIPFDYDYKKWNFCVECACLRNNCPVSRFQKRRLRFQKLQQTGSSPTKKFHKSDKVSKLTIKSPIKSPTKSPVKSPVRTPEKQEIPTPTPETIHVSPQMPSPNKMVRRSQVPRQNSSSNASTQASGGRVRSLRVPSQTKDESSLSEPLTIPDSTALRCSETDRLTSPQTSSSSDTNNKESCNNINTADTPKPEEKKKLTREERKMEAIMKAFEKMEKRNARKASHDHCKVKVTPDVKKEREPLKEKEEKDTKTIKKEKEKQIEPEIKEEPKVEEIKEKKPVIVESMVSPEKTVSSCENVDIETEIKVKEEQIEANDEERTRPNLRERPPPPPKTKKTKKSGGRRRLRNTSGAGSTSNDVPSESNEENSNSMPIQSISCPSTPAVQIEQATQPSFRLLKTKRHLMNEWLSEKSQDTKTQSKSEPLEVSVEEDNMFIHCLPSPRNSMDRLRRHSQSSGVRERSSSLLVETSAGSAKKRWLRQAMGEGSESNSGMCSPVPPTGGMSPNPQAAMPSPGGSPPVDFVTPLKKRRLARESLSRDSKSTNESPAVTPAPVTPSPAAPSGSSYFGSLNESFEHFKNKNGFKTLFSPIQPSDVESDSVCEPSPVEKTVVDVNHSEVVSADDSSERTVHTVVSKESTDEVRAESSVETMTAECVDEKNGDVSSCAEMDCSLSCDTGTNVCLDMAGTQISNPEVKSSTEVEDVRTHSEQIVVCDQVKSATSEPDSSDSVCQGSDNVQMDVECDSGSSEPTNVTAPVEASNEVDSTETGAASKFNSETSSENTTTQCDSCNSERSTSLVLDRSVLPGPSNVTDNSKVCTSSSLSSSLLALHGGGNDLNLSSRSVVDSSTDQLTHSSTDPPRLRRNSVSGSFLIDSAVTSNSSSSFILDGNVLTNISSHQSVDNEVSNSFILESVQSNISRNILGSVNFTDPFSVTSNSSTDIPPVRNRHLKFLSDANYSADTTVDSTTQFVPPVGSGLINTNNMSTLVGYDSDSMDVTSASETGLGASYDDSRRGSEDSLTGFPEPSTSAESSQPPKEKKKVSLQEYLKRKKDKTSTTTSITTTITTIHSVPQQQQQQTSTLSVAPSTTPVPGPSKISTVSSTTISSPLKLTNPITLKNLDKKLPPLPSLPSLPMFEKTERKEFKSSSDILSPIFNREKKQEDVRKPMSLTERLKQEFGLDDTTDNDGDSDQNTESSYVKNVVPNGDGVDVPPPPPPPPPQGQSSKSPRITNGASVPSLLNIKTYQSPSLKLNDASFPAAATGTHATLQPGSSSSKSLPGSTGTVVTPNKSQLASTLQAPLSNILSNVRDPQKVQNDLTAQLAAIKAQISKVQKSLPNPASSQSLPSSNIDQIGNNSLNGVSVSNSKPQVFDYGHQSNNNFLRLNSHPGSSNTNYHSYKKPSQTSSNIGKVSPRLKVSPPSSMNHAYDSNNHSQNGPGTQSFNNHQDSSPSWKRGLSASHTSTSRKPYSKQSSQKY
ncbi:Histone-lysine N-methyltransferase 2E [Mactra antiquata]